MSKTNNNVNEFFIIDNLININKSNHGKWPKCKVLLNLITVNLNLMVIHLIINRNNELKKLNPILIDENYLKILLLQ